MIDKTKNYIENFVTTKIYKWKYSGEGNYTGQKMYTRKIYNPKAKNKYFAIKLCKIINENTGEEFIMFKSSIRKWYFGCNTRQDLNWEQYVNCIKILSDEIGVREIDMWNSRVTTLEIGVNLLLKKSLQNLNDCLVRYRNLKRQPIKTSLYFKGANFKIKIYAKWTEIFKAKKMNIYQQRFATNFHLVRTEIVIKKMSGFFKEQASTLGDIRDNWNQLLNRLKWYVKRIDFVDRISPRIKIKDVNTEVDYYGFQLHKRINKKFFSNLKAFEKLHFSQNNKPDGIKKFFSSFERGVSKITDFKGDFHGVLDKKTCRLYNKGNL